MPASEPVLRRAARVLLVDERDRLLLFRGGDPDRPHRTFWFTPGGGIDQGETPQQCALRELAEETGLRSAELGPLVWTRRAQFTFLGTPYDQREVFFLVRCPVFEVDTSGFTDLERRSHCEHRWWSVDELAGTDEEFAPGDLPVRVAQLLRDGPGQVPVEVAGATAP